MRRFQPYLLASLAYLVLAPGIVSIWSLILAVILPGSVWSFSSAHNAIALAAGYVALLFWLRGRLRRSNPRPPYVLFSIVYWTLAPALAAVPAMVVGHCDPQAAPAQQSACMAQSLTAFWIGLALALVLYLVLLAALRRRSRGGAAPRFRGRTPERRIHAHDRAADMARRPDTP
jgi:hypothetical protein